MAQYEIAVLFDQGLEIDLEKASGKVEAIIAANGGKVTATDNWGKRKLAYPINKQEFAIYVFYTVEMDGQGIQKINDTLNITDEVVRFLIVRPDLKKQAKAEAARAEKAAKAAERGDKADDEPKDEE
ncbi:MAG: 30S ribosomal protein S6 [Candidatus Saccharimonadales bacterium]